MDSMDSMKIMNICWENDGDVFYDIPSGNLLHSYGKIHHFIAGKINYFNGHFQ